MKQCADWVILGRRRVDRTQINHVFDLSGSVFSLFSFQGLRPEAGLSVKASIRSNTLLVTLKMWGYSSVGRAPALQAGGQEFESPYLHQCCSFMFFRKTQHKEKMQHTDEF